jgi:lysophospholipase L1-like esterase
MKAELTDMKMELNSFKEIVKVLQEELREFNLSSQPTNSIGSSCNVEEKSQLASVDGEWMTFSSNRLKKPRLISKNLQYIPTSMSNQFATLVNLKNNDASSGSVLQEKNLNTMKSHYSGHRIRTKSVGNQKILIVGDSHCRGIAVELKHCLGANYKISSFVQPGAEMGGILSSLQNDIRNLKQNDVLVIWGGSNDIGKNNANTALTHLSKFVERNQKVNTIVMTTPLRHDLIASSCVNNEVTNFNMRLIKRLAPYRKVKILAANLVRKYFTKHGMHLNTAGKERAARGLAMVVRSFRKSNRTSPISPCWKDDNSANETVGSAPDPSVNVTTSMCNAPARDGEGKDPTGTQQDSVQVEDKKEGRNGPNQESEISKESAGNSKQCPAFRVSESTINTSSKESDSDDNWDEPQLRTSNRPKKNPSLRNGDFLWT